MKPNPPIGRVVDHERTIAAIVDDPACLFHPAPLCVFTDGFAVGYNIGNSLYCCQRDEVMRAHRIPGRLWHWFPKTGRYHIGFVLVDNEGSSFAFDFHVQQKPMFRVATTRQDGLRHIYFTAKTYDLEFAQTFEMQFEGDGTPQAVEGLVFLPAPLEQSLARFETPLVVSSDYQQPSAVDADALTGLRLHNPAGLRLDHELLRFPLPSALADLHTVRLGRTDVPFHLRRIGSHPTHPNLQLEALIESGPGRSANLTLARGGAGGRPAKPMTCETSADFAAVDDGVHRWELRLRDGKLEVSRASDPSPLTLAPVMEGCAGPFVVRRAGLREVYRSPLTVELACEVVFGDPADPAIEVVHGTLLRFVRGADRIDLEHLLENHSRSAFLYLKRYGVRLTPATALSAVAPDGTCARVAGFDVFRHTDQDIHRAMLGLPKNVAPLDHTVVTGPWQFTVGDFATVAPIRLRWRDGGLDLDLLPAASEVRLDSDEEYRFRNQFFLDEGRYKLREGMARRHASSLCRAAAPTPAAVRAEAVRLDQPPYLHTPAVLNGSVWVMAPAYARRAAFRRAAGTWLEQWQANEAVMRPWNFFSGGDWFGERVNNWGNSEYDTPLGALQMFLGTGDPEWRRRGLAAARHQMDVDTYHGEHPRGGWQIGHSLAHGGNYFPDEYRVGAKNAGVGVAHVWVEGMLLDYWMTGDERARAVAVRMLDDLAGPELVNWRMDTERDAGWHLIHLCAGAAILQDARYRKAAARLVTAILERQRSDGSFRRVLTSDHCRCFPKHTGCVSFMLGILLAGLKRYHQLTGDAATADALVRLARYLVQDMWDPAQETFRYTSCPASNPIDSRQMIEGLSYAFRLSGDAAGRRRWTREYRRTLAWVFPPEMVRHERVYGEEAFGKSLSQMMRMAGPVGVDVESMR